MLFRTALALMELYGPALVTTKDAGDAITLLQSLTGSTFDSSQLVLTACMGFLAVTETRLQELREMHRPARDPGSLEEERTTTGGDDVLKDEDNSKLESHSSNSDELLNGLSVDSEVDSLPDLQEQFGRRSSYVGCWRRKDLLYSANLLWSMSFPGLLHLHCRAEELKTALVEMVKQDNRRQLHARVLMQVEQEQKVTEDAHRTAEQEAAAQKYVVHVLQVPVFLVIVILEKYKKTMASLAEMEKRWLCRKLCWRLPCNMNLANLKHNLLHGLFACKAQ
ncbi:TBC1 domain family member 8B [Quillaja saponaria]|uniref:TBC1 domain family member 8B n=1 Tax=Quillaja saponaria TaxID=32244 RepID=A0AAD7Q072_QUISA|nr:TBC1 domain family member 8B [Quillaja saponaria]